MALPPMPAPALDVPARVVDNEAHAMTVLNGDPARRLTAGQVFPGASTDEIWYPKAGDGDGDLVYVSAYGGSAVVAVTNNRLVD